jgi:hypothetical protein
MTNLATMRTRIAAEMKRGDLSASSSVVTDAIVSAIEFYETQKAYFNETQVDITASSGQEYYSLPEKFVEMDSLAITINNRSYTLDPTTFQHIDNISTTAYTGTPQIYTQYKKQFRVYPIPNSSSDVFTLSYTTRLADLSAGSSSNDWMTIGEKTIRARAKGELFMHQLRNPKLAQVMYDEADKAFKQLKRETAMRFYGGKLTPTVF